MKGVIIQSLSNEIVQTFLKRTGQELVYVLRIPIGWAELTVSSLEVSTFSEKDLEIILNLGIEEVERKSCEK